ncbi:MAG: GNAT family N-acetyltransferase [Oscillospiraceae bacterium]|nr:GNAT family N-acetyltransferase [Oscillospiraceae bacterium]
MEFISKFFDELTPAELYGILQARSAVFVVEQNCAYQDIDGHDPESLHVFCIRDGRIAAYLRAFRRDEKLVQMGRVLTTERGTGLGGRLLRTGIAEIRERLHPSQIYIEAQCYAVGFYEREGFRTCSEEFLEDGIPHVQMMLDLK